MAHDDLVREPRRSASTARTGRGTIIHRVTRADCDRCRAIRVCDHSVEPRRIVNGSRGADRFQYCAGATSSRTIRDAGAVGNTSCTVGNYAVIPNCAAPDAAADRRRAIPNTRTIPNTPCTIPNTRTVAHGAAGNARPNVGTADRHARDRYQRRNRPASLYL